MQLIAFFLGCSLSDDTTPPAPDRGALEDPGGTGGNGETGETGQVDSGAADTGADDGGGGNGGGNVGGAGTDTATDSGGADTATDSGGSDTATSDTAADSGGADTASSDTATDTGGADTADTADTATDTGGADTDTATSADPAEACHPDIAGWPRAWADLEEDVLDLVNAHRAAGADCGTRGYFPPVAPLVMSPEARCAARYHSKWMHDNAYFGHGSVGGDLGDAWNARMVNAGYDGDPYSENIASGYRTASGVVSAWMGSSGHCANIMASYPDDTGIGFYEGTLNRYRYWTHNFGR